jgi:hypothetical protein
MLFAYWLLDSDSWLLALCPMLHASLVASLKKLKPY